MKPAAVKDWKCAECGKRYTLKGAERALDKGCKCGGYDIDLCPTNEQPARAPGEGDRK